MMESQEIQWKSIIDNEWYEVSNSGFVRSFKGHHGRRRDTPKIMKACNATSGYKCVRLCSKKFEYIHRLVSVAFIPNPENKPCVNHLDGNKHNNHVSNLQWVSFSENNKHAYIMGLKKPSYHVLKKGSDSFRAKEVLQIDLNGVTLRKWGSATEAAIKLGWHVNTKAKIGACCLGRQKTCNGFKWAFA